MTDRAIRRLFPFLCAMATAVVVSNILVQYPVQIRVGALDLANLLTWGAFTYPFAFLVTDLANRTLGPAAARRIVYAGFALAVVLSAWLSTPRIALASGTAFLFAQLLDVAVFAQLSRARHHTTMTTRYPWWRPPLVSSALASVLDTVLFFTLAFAASLAFLGSYDVFAVAPTALLGLLPVEAPRWISWAVGDLIVKLASALALLIPYRIAIKRLLPRT